MSFISLPTTGQSPFWGNSVNSVGNLPASAEDGAVILVKDTNSLYRYDQLLTSWVEILDGLADVSGPSSATDNAIARFDGTTGKVIQGSVPTIDDAGIITAPSFTGNLTGDVTGNVTGNLTGNVTGNVTGNLTGNVTGNIDSVATGGTDTLSIGAANADVVNIGRAGATVNVQGDTFYQNVTNLDVTDKNITVNKGGSAGSGNASGLDVEEASAIAGYVRTSGDRNSWQLKAPNTAGVAAVVPGAGGITLDQSSHNPVTIGTANGLSLSTQALSLQAATSSQNGALVSTDWSAFNAKVDGPGSATDNALARFDGTTGKLVQNSLATLDDSGALASVSIEASSIFMPPRLNNTQRDALTGVNGMLIYNTTDNRFQGFVDGSWIALHGWGY